MLGIYLVLLWESASLLHLYNGNAGWLSKLLTGSLSGIFPSVFGLSTTLADVGYMCISTIISVAAHEFGHALAAASEGIQIEYIAVFVAILFPGALVAFNYEVLQALSKFATLRIYCAGIWHNVACCAVCGLTLFLLPLILYPFYIHGKIPMVLDVPSSSPLSGFLSSGDLVMAMDGISIRNPQEWMEVAAHIHEQTLRNSNISSSFQFKMANRNKGYCVPSSLMDASKDVVLTDDQSTCPNEYAAFTALPCSNSSMLDDGTIADKYQNSREGIHCLIAKDIVKLRKCGDGWANSASNRSSCPCFEDDTCLAPVQLPGFTWVEIIYLRPYSSDCWQLARNLFVGMKIPDFDEKGCSGAFVFVGDVLSMAFSIRLTAYRPRWLFSFVARLPNVLEKISVCTFHVSLALALLNSLPVYFLDGESILEVAICYLRVLGPRMKERVLRLCLLAGTLISIFALLKIFLLTIFFAEET